MKPLFVMVLLVLNAKAAKAQVTRNVKKIDSLDVPAVIMQKLHKLVPTYKKLSWKYEHITQAAGPTVDFYRSEFEQEGSPGRTTFDGDGTLLDFQVYAKLDTLPNSVKRTIKKRMAVIQTKYPLAVAEICVLGDTDDEKLDVTYSVDFYKSYQGKLDLERLGSYELELNSRGKIQKRDKNHHVDFR